MPRQLGGQAIKYSQFRMVDGVQPVLLHHRPITNMADLLLVNLMARVDLGLIKFTLLEVRCLIPEYR